ncbi:MAG: hypothetical protein CMJ46_05090, partial [Planctomyces sp.]|nr:hypothetical protein [Planctomyces sp.]
MSSQGPKKDLKLFRVIGATVCATVAAASLWLLYPSETVETVRAGEARGNANTSRYSTNNISATRYLSLGKEHLRAGRQSAAVRAFRAAMANASELSANERDEARRYLNQLDPASGRDQQMVNRDMQVPAQPSKSVEAIKIDDLMTRARLALHQGEHKDAWRLAAQADNLVKQHEVELSPIAKKPADFLNDLASGKITMRGQSPEEEENPFQLIDEPAVDAEADTAEATASLKEKAQALLKSAEEDLAGGYYDDARQKALEANELHSEWTLFETSPEAILREVDHATGGKTLLSKSTNAANVDSEASKKKVVELLSQARLAIEAGKLDVARNKATEAKQYNVPFGKYDDRPELVLSDINRLEGSMGFSAFNPNPNDARAVENSSKYLTARKLLADARQLLMEDDLQAAKAKALEAERLDVAYEVSDDRPDAVLLEINRRIAKANGAEGATPALSASKFGQLEEMADALAGKPAPGMNQKPAVTGYEQNPFMQNNSEEQAGEVAVSPIQQIGYQQIDSAEEPNAFGAMETAPQEIAAVVPEGLTATQLFDHGVKLMQSGKRTEAYNAFLKAYQSGDQLDQFRARNLPELLQATAPARKGPIEQTTAVQDFEPEIPDQLNLAAQEEVVRFDRLRTEVMNATFRADRLTEKDPQKALEILDRALATVEGAELSEQMSAPLLKQLASSRASIEQYQTRMKPVLEQEARNKAVEEGLQRDIDNEIRVEQEIADLVDEYNKMMKQGLYADAERLAKEVKELDPSNEVGVSMFWKAKIQRRHASNLDLQERKEEGFWAALDDVEQSAVPFSGAPFQHGDIKEWKQLTDRRKNLRSNTRHRTLKEIQIDESLHQKISLNFEQAPMEEVFAHIEKVMSINVWLDTKAMADAGVEMSTPVTIKVRDIQLRSALSLMLEQMGLAYMIDHEVLKITSVAQQKGKMRVATYDVADLVMPLNPEAYNPNLGRDPFAHVNDGLNN